MAARDGWDVYGADLSFGMLQQAAATAEGPSWIGADADAVPFADETFDAVMMLGVIGYANEPQRTLAEVTRVLRPGGHLVIAWTGRPTLLESLSRHASAVPDKLYLGLKHLVMGAPLATRVWPPSFFQAHGKFWNERDFCRILGDFGYDVIHTRAIHFGRFRFMDRALWPPAVDAAVSIALEQIARLGPLSVLRNRASTHVAVARRVRAKLDLGPHAYRACK
jgi:SAM-dependent methyltransferase